MATKKELLAQEVAKAVGAGKTAALETVDFNDPNRPKTCLEVDFPILPVNQVAIIEGNAGKPIYQMSKWWARRRSSVFRSMLIAAATKAPEDKSHAAKLVWDNYYANHQKKGAFKHLKVADIFMGGGTTLVEGSRLGMQMVGNDLNPVAWFVVKQELANVDLEQVKKLLTDIEAEVKPQIMPYYYCDGPEGEKGSWTHLPTKKVMPADFNPLSIPRDERKDYHYEGPEIIYTFWAKHGPCQVTGCGHRTPIMSSPVMAVKSISVKHWEHSCSKCGGEFHVEEDVARMAPDAPLYVAPSEHSYSVLDRRKGVICPHCGYTAMVNLGKPNKPNKKVELSLLVHPQWLAGSPKQDAEGQPYGGSAQDDVAATTRWDSERASKIRLLEVRGALPDEVTCPETKITFAPEIGTVPKKSHYACAGCGTVQDVLTTTARPGRWPDMQFRVTHPSGMRRANSTAVVSSPPTTQRAPDSTTRLSRNGRRVRRMISRITGRALQFQSVRKLGRTMLKDITIHIGGRCSIRASCWCMHNCLKPLLRLETTTGRFASMCWVVSSNTCETSACLASGILNATRPNPHSRTRDFSPNTLLSKTASFRNLGEAIGPPVWRGLSKGATGQIRLGRR